MNSKTLMSNGEWMSQREPEYSAAFGSPPARASACARRTTPSSNAKSPALGAASSRRSATPLPAMAAACTKL